MFVMAPYRWLKDHPKRGWLLGALLAVVLLGAAIRQWGSGFTKGLIAPAPQSVLDTEWVPELPPSNLNVPITYDLSPVIEALEGVVPWTYGDLEERHEVESNDRIEVAFALQRSPFKARLEGDVAHVSTVITYKGQGWYDVSLLPEVGASCGMEDDNEQPPRAVVALSAQMSLDDDWGLVGVAAVDRVVPASPEERDRCEVTVFDIDVTEEVLGAANGLIVDHLPEVEAAIASIDVRSKFEGWWRTLHEPIEITDDVWLTINPISVRRGATEGRAQTLVATVGLTAKPRIDFGARPTVNVKPLPALDSATVNDGLRILATGRAEYRRISEQLNELLAGEVLERDGRSIRLRRLQLRGIGGGRVALEVSFDGEARGRLFLVGTPLFDHETGQVHVPDLEFDVDTSDLLVSGYAWLGEQGITDFLRERARWPVDDLASLAGEQLAWGLNRHLTEDVELRGTVNSVEILGVYAMVEQLVVHAQANAVGELIIEEVEEEASPNTR